MTSDSARHWGRVLNGRGIEVKLLPAANNIRAYMKRNKANDANTRALLETTCCADSPPVRVKSVEQLALDGCRTHFPCGSSY